MKPCPVPLDSLLRILCVPGGRYAELRHDSGADFDTSILDNRPELNRSAREVIFSHCESEKERARKITLRAMNLKADLIAALKAEQARA